MRVRVTVATPAAPLEVRERVRAALGERNPMMHLEPARVAAAHADAVTGAYLLA